MAGVSVSTPSKENSPTYGLSKTGAALTDKAQLNIASSILTQDVIDGLKKADESVQVKPLTLKIDKNTKKQADITALTTLVSNLKTSYADVANETAMLKRTVSAAGSGSVTASVEAGVAEQTVRLSVSQIAQVDSYQSKGFTSRSDTLNLNKEESLTLSVGDKSVDIKVGASTTLESIINQINDGAGDVLKASIVNTGGENGYKMILQSKESGEKNQIKFSVKGDDQTALQGAQNVLKELGFNTKAEEIKDNQGTITGYNLVIDTADTSAGGKQLQKAQDAKFNFNGIDITRSSNKVDDLIIGVTFNLNNVDEKNSTTGALKESVITIGKDTDAVVKSLKSMVTAYNDLISNITTATSYDRENDVAGTLNGMSEITGIKRKLQNLFESTNSDGKSLQSFGFSFTEKGVLSVDESKLKDAINKDYEGFKSFFTNSTEYKNAGVFGKVEINQKLDDISNAKLKINGKEITINLQNGNNAVKNANELVKLINDADIPNVKARIADNGVLQLIGTSGKDIEISKDSDSTLLTALGLVAGTTPGSSTKKKGFFDKLGDIVTGLIGKEGTLTNLTTSLKDKAKIVKSQKDRVQATLDKKYTMMQKQFSTIAVQMNALENSFNSLKNTFDAMLNSNK
ncbi:MAG: flagellar filament capping protein FliD [Campylobacter sp.]|uniref:flagellar filament capping protein FliD n=1 Tax=Campylobacter sp. TaxID=205 RepID=UPI0029757D04|nr:flagellar filament capping protein FliD [Campylobacter sp.]MDD7599864.1 flagellar filament capping protein FliD [Campylobacteraceae bacterium]MDY5888083.1 flagellar filament capping protein FliD [Campylobacter sp.]